MSDDALPAFPVDQVFVIPFVCCLHGDVLASDHGGLLTLREVARRSQADAAAGRAPRESSGPTQRKVTAGAMDPEFLAANPWLLKYLAPDKVLKDNGGVEADSSAEEEIEAAELSDDQVLDMFKQLDTAKEDMLSAEEAHAYVRVPDFRVAPRWGKSQYAKAGQALDCYQAQVVRHSEASIWCLGSGLQQTKKFNVKGFSPEVCLKLAHAWCHRMQWLWDTHDPVAPHDQYPQEVLDTYKPHPLFMELKETSTGLCLARCEEILRLRPA